MKFWQKIALVTGANSGLGKEIALRLAKSGAHVIMVCRNLVKGTAALAEIKVKSNSDSIDLLIADLSSQAEIRTLAKTMEIYTNYNQIALNLTWMYGILS
jgi:NAD(P)-dependent dehydrogenase (short-subunit alcohol dehydrogenase family)